MRTRNIKIRFLNTELGTVYDLLLLVLVLLLMCVGCGEEELKYSSKIYYGEELKCSVSLWREVDGVKTDVPCDFYSFEIKDESGEVLYGWYNEEEWYEDKLVFVDYEADKFYLGSKEISKMEFLYGVGYEMNNHYQLDYSKEKKWCYGSKILQDIRRRHHKLFRRATNG